MKEKEIVWKSGEWGKYSEPLGQQTDMDTQLKIDSQRVTDNLNTAGRQTDQAKGLEMSRRTQNGKEEEWKKAEEIQLI